MPVHPLFRRSSNFIHAQGMRGALAGTAPSRLHRAVLLGCMMASLLAAAAIVNELRKPYSPSKGGRALFSMPKRRQGQDCPGPAPEDPQTVALRILRPKPAAGAAASGNASSAGGGAGALLGSSKQPAAIYDMAAVANRYVDVYWGDTMLQLQELGPHLHAKVPI